MSSCQIHKPQRIRIIVATNRRQTARAFTLVEMLVVVSIIGVLASLISVAAYQGLQAAKRARTQTEITNLASAIESFKLACHGEYPPSYLDHRDLNARALMMRFLAKAFPRCNPNVEVWYIPWCNTSQQAAYYPYLQSDGMTVALWDPTTGSSISIPQNGSPTPYAPMSPMQALVFWLTSFSKDPVHPLSAPTTDRQSFFDFDIARIQRINSGGTNGYSTTVSGWTVLTSTTSPPLGTPPVGFTLATSTACPLYNPGSYFPRDGNQQPYVYFEARCYLLHAMFLASAFPASNPPNTVPYLSQATPWDTNGTGLLEAGPPTNSPTPEITTDASGNILSALNDSNTSFSDFQKRCVNPKSFQIICAGADNDFGTINTTATTGNSPGLPAPGVSVNYLPNNLTGTAPQNYLIYYKSFPDGQGYNTTTNADDDNLTNFTEKTLGQAKPQ